MPRLPAIRPMTLVRSGESFSDPDWLFEVKHDGFRGLCYIEDGTVKLVSRRGHVYKTLPQPECGRMENMNSVSSGHYHEGLTLRQAALIAGFSYLLMPVTLAEFYINPKLLISGNIEQTTQNIVAHGRLFGAAVLCYLITLILDVVIAWALYILLAPVNRALSLLTAWFRLIYTTIALFALLNLTTVYRLLTVPDYVAAFGTGPLHAQVLLLLNSYRYDWSMSLIIFGIHLGLLGYLIYRSGYIPKILGILFVLDGLGWLITPLKPYLYPNANFGFFFPFSFVELVLPLWLVIKGWKIQGREEVV